MILKTPPAPDRELVFSCDCECSVLRVVRFSDNDGYSIALYRLTPERIGFWNRVKILFGALPYESSLILGDDKAIELVDFLKENSAA